MNASTSRTHESIGSDHRSTADADSRENCALRRQPHVVLDDYRFRGGELTAVVEVVKRIVVNCDMGPDFYPVTRFDPLEGGDGHARVQMDHATEGRGRPRVDEELNGGDDRAKNGEFAEHQRPMVHNPGPSGDRAWGPTAALRK